MFSTPMLVWLDTRLNYGDERWIGLGVLRNIVVVIVYVERENDIIRIISMRKAKKHERGAYQEKISHGLGTA